MSDSPDKPAFLAADSLRPSIWLNLLLLAFGIAILFIGLGRSRVLTQHEVFAAEPSREMLKDGHWIIPTFGGIPRLVKPPTTGWLIAASMAIFQSREEWVVRLPCAMAGLVTAGLVAAMAWRWFGYSAAVAAWCIQLTSYYLLLQARLAEADMPLCASVCAAMLAFGYANVESPREKMNGIGPVLTFHFAMALSFLFKGVGPLFILSGCLCFICWTRQWRCLRFVFHPVGLALFIACAAAWPIAAWRSYPSILTIWRRETLGRAAGEFGVPEAWYFYLWNVPMLLLPWLPLAVVGLVKGWRERFHFTTLGKFLISWFLAGAILLSCFAFKHKHYVIPMLPPLTLASVVGLKLWLNDAASKSLKSHLIGIIILLFVCIVGYVANLKSQQPAKLETMWIIAIVAGGGVAMLLCFAQRRPLAAGISLIGLIAGVSLVINVSLIRQFDEYYQESAALAGRVNALLPKDQTIHLVGMGEAQMTFYLRFPFDRAEKADIAPMLDVPANETKYFIMPAGVLADELFASMRSIRDGNFARPGKLISLMHRAKVIDFLASLKRKDDEGDRIF